MATDVNDFNLLSENFTDKVRYVYEGSTPFPTGTSGNYVDAPVPDSTLMLPTALVSKDGISWVSADAPKYGYAGTGTELSVTVYSHPQRMRLFITAPDYTGTMYYRIVGLKK